MSEGTTKPEELHSQTVDKTTTFKVDRTPHPEVAKAAEVLEAARKAREALRQ